MKDKQNIILIGFMGCGKTSIGRRLSYKLRIPVEDTDKLIEQKKGQRISEIFEQSGEAAFRTMETELLNEIAQRDYKRIISVGGGLPVREENQVLLKKCGFVIYLRTDAETIYERLKDDCTRPLLQCENPLEKIKSLMASREEAYVSCADFIVEEDGRNEEECAELIRKELECRRNAAKKNKTKLLVINGPNLNFLGIREKAIYGNEDYDYLLAMIEKKGKECNAKIEVFQSNHEGAIIDRIQKAYFDGSAGIVINPGAYTHYSYAIHDALASITTIPKIEIHISDITKREDFRKISVTAPACDGQIYGQGLNGYLLAIDKVLEIASSSSD